METGLNRLAKLVVIFFLIQLLSAMNDDFFFYCSYTFATLDFLRYN